MDPHVPLVSIGLPVYNGENFVAEAIQCAVSQTFTDWELIISDNASTDQTVSICREFAAADSRICVYQNERNLGVCPNYNRVFRLSRGRYFKWITHDDFFGPQLVERCIEVLEADDRVALAFPAVVHVDAEGRRLRQQSADLSISDPNPEARIRQLMHYAAESEDIFWAQFGLMRRSLLEETQLMGLYNGSDQTFLLEVILQGHFKQLETELLYRRKHSAAATVRRNWTAWERAKFAHADDKRTVVFPYSRMLQEHLGCLWNSSLPLGPKLRCTSAVLRRFSVQWKYFAEEFRVSPLEAVKRRSSAA